MKQVKGVQYSIILLLLINFLTIIYNGALYIQITNYVISKGQMILLLGELNNISKSPDQIFWYSIIFFVGIIFISTYKMYSTEKKWPIFSKWNLFEIVLMIGVIWSQNLSYNGIILLVFADIFYSSREFQDSDSKRSWIIFIFLSFLMLLLTDYEILSLFIKVPSLSAYIQFYPSSIRGVVLFLENALTSLNVIIFIISLLSYILYVIKEHHNIEEELKMLSRVNTELNHYISLSEKIAEDRERKRIAREIHDTLGHALTGISAGIDAVSVLIDVHPIRAKEQLKNVSNAVREGIKDVRGSLHRLRPGALQNNGLKDALILMISEYESLSKLSVDLKYEWGNIDLDVMQEDTIFRIIQESMTNSVRHGHASKMSIRFMSEDNNIIVLHDNGIGFDDLQIGYGLKQMRERVSILGGSIHFENRKGFYTKIVFPKIGGEVYDKGNDCR